MQRFMGVPIDTVADLVRAFEENQNAPTNEALAGLKDLRNPDIMYDTSAEDKILKRAILSILALEAKNRKYRRELEEARMYLRKTANDIDKALREMG